jgi:hypothetical protein
MSIVGNVIIFVGSLILFRLMFEVPLGFKEVSFIFLVSFVTYVWGVYIGWERKDER